MFSTDCFLRDINEGYSLLKDANDEQSKLKGIK